MRKKDKDVDDAQDFAGMPASTVVTPADIQSKEFGVSRFGGYRMRDVDEFLDHITEAMTKLSDENERLRTATGLPAAPSIGAPDLADTSRQADEIIERARAEAATIVQDARAQAAAAAGWCRGGDRCRARRRRPVPVPGTGFPAAVGRARAVPRRIGEGHGEGEPGQARGRAAARRASSRQRPLAARRRPRARRRNVRRPRLPPPTRRSPCPRSDPGNDSVRGVRIVATGDGVADPGGRPRRPR